MLVGDLSPMSGSRGKKILTVTAVAAVFVLMTLHWASNDGAIAGFYRHEDNPRCETAKARNATAGQGLKFHVESPDKQRGRNIFYNRVGKCGSRSLLSAVWSLTKKNNFTWNTSDVTDEQRPEPLLALEEVVKVASLKPRTFYDRHIHYLDFGAIGYPKPIYINMVREPIARFVSWYSYLKYGDLKGNRSKKGWPDINECIESEVSPCTANGSSSFKIGMYFCGLDSVCKIPGPERVRLAKRHIDNEYALVGLLEDFTSTLRLLELMIPEYFEGITDSWEHKHDEKAETATIKKEKLTEKSIFKLKNKMMVDEYQVYNYAKEKFNFLKEKYGLH